MNFPISSDPATAFKGVLMAAHAAAPAADQTKRDAASLQASMVADQVGVFFTKATKDLSPRARERALYLAVGHVVQLGTSANEPNVKKLVERCVAVAGYEPEDLAFYGTAVEAFAGALLAGLHATGVTSDRTSLVLSAAELAAFFEKESAEMPREARGVALRMVIPWLTVPTWSQASKPDVEQLVLTAIRLAPYTMVAAGVEVGEVVPSEDGWAEPEKGGAQGPKAGAQAPQVPRPGPHGAQHGAQGTRVG